MTMSRRKGALFSLAGGVGFGACGLLVLLMARESLMSMFSLKFLSGCIGSGLLFGLGVALCAYCSQQERLEGIGDAIAYSFIPLCFGALCIGALAEKSSSDDRRYVLLATACILVWWLLMLFAGIATSHGARWGNTLQSWLVAMPLLAVLVGVLYSTAAQSPAPDSFWSHWNGTRLVGIVILAPVCIFGLFLSLLSRGLVFLVAGFAAALMIGAGLGELIIGSFGWPVAGAFAGGIMSVVAAACVLARCARA